MQLREFCRFSTLKTNFFLVLNCGGFEQSAASQQQSPERHKLISHSKQEDKKPLRSYQFGSSVDNLVPRGSTPILGHIKDVRPEWVSFPGRKPADGCKFLTKNLRMGHNFDIILPGNGWFSSKLNKTYRSLVNFYCK